MLFRMFAVDPEKISSISRFFSKIGTPIPLALPLECRNIFTISTSPAMVKGDDVKCQDEIHANIGHVQIYYEIWLWRKLKVATN